MTLHIDREDETIKEAKTIYPELFKKYDYRKSIPKVEFEQVEGYEKIEEIEAIKKKQKAIEKAIEEYVNKSEDKI